MQLMLATACILLAIAMAGANNERDGGFVAFGHMANHPVAVDWYVENGMNGIEADLNINEDGSLGNFQHKGVCDCSCICAVGSRCSDTNACRVLWDATGSHCNAAASAEELTEHILGKSEIAVFYVDSKIDPDEMTADALNAAGQNVVDLIERHGHAYEGQIIVGVGKDSANSQAYLKAVVAAAEDTSIPNRYFVTVDGMGTNFAEAANALVSISKNRVASTGITICLPSTYFDAVQLGAVNTAAGSMAGSGIWTLDDRVSMESYFRAGATAIMTNEPQDLKGAIGSARMATPSLRTLLPATTDIIVTESDCDCDYHPGGCEISTAAPKNSACKCNYRGAWTCRGQVVLCLDPNSPDCANPDKSFTSCLLGGGDCGAYSGEDDCDCDYSRGGCKISKAAPKYSACKCKYRGFWTCAGGVVQCKVPTSVKCEFPDRSRAACRLGGGDCDGY